MSRRATMGQSVTRDDRPNPLQLCETLRGLKDCWHELDLELTRTSGKASRGNVEGKVPLDIDVLDAKTIIDGLALNYCQILLDETTWKPGTTDTPTLLEALAMRIGHFTANPDPLVAWDFAEDVETVSEKAWRVARPDAWTWIPIDRPCYVDGCPGHMYIHINRDDPRDEASLAIWRPTAVCFTESVTASGKRVKHMTPTHQIDAKLLRWNVAEEVTAC